MKSAAEMVFVLSPSFLGGQIQTVKATGDAAAAVVTRPNDDDAPVGPVVRQTSSIVVEETAEDRRILCAQNKAKSGVSQGQKRSAGTFGEPLARERRGSGRNLLTRTSPSVASPLNCPLLYVNSYGAARCRIAVQWAGGGGGGGKMARNLPSRRCVCED